MLSVLNFNQIIFCQDGVSEIALYQWFMGKMTNEESLGTLRMAPGETQRGPIDTSAKPWYRKWP